MLVFEEKRKIGNPDRNLSEQSKAIVGHEIDSLSALMTSLTSAFHELSKTS